MCIRVCCIQTEDIAITSVQTNPQVFGYLRHNEKLSSIPIVCELLVESERFTFVSSRVHSRCVRVNASWTKLTD